MKEILPKDFAENPFKMIGDDWLLITAEKDGKTNAMTASWGGIGVIWNKNVTYTFIRDSRYTKEFVDNNETYSLCVFDHDANKEMLGYMGSVSGRTEDKVAKCGLTVEKAENKDTPPGFPRQSKALSSVRGRNSSLPCSPGCQCGKRAHIRQKAGKIQTDQ